MSRLAIAMLIFAAMLVMSGLWWVNAPAAFPAGSASDDYDPGWIITEDN